MATPLSETSWEVPATAAAGAALRDLDLLYGAYRNGIPDNLFVDASRATTSVVLYVNGRRRPIPAGGNVEIREREVGKIHSYYLVPVAALSADQVVVYERRIGNGGVS